MNEIKLGWDTGMAKAEGNYMLEGREYCKHDSIPRKCDSCDYEEEIDKLTKALEKVQNIAFRVVGNMWEEDSAEIERICNEALK